MMFYLVIWALSCLGFFALAASMCKHQKQMFGKELSLLQTRSVSFIGWFILLVALVLCLCIGAISNMFSYWLGTLSIAALFVSLCLSYFETKIKIIVIFCAVITVISGIVYLI